MRTTNFFKKENFRFGMLSELFFPPKPVQTSQSIEDLETEISTVEYLEKVKWLVRKDLLRRYTEETVKKGLENFKIQITTTAPSRPQIVVEEEPVNNEADSISTGYQHEILTDEKQQEIWKVQSRIPKWFKKTNQYNSQILIAYMDLLGDNKSVPLYKLESVCRKIKTFKNNYSQMKIISDRNHAKVFEESGGRITLWEPVREFVKQEFKKFKKRNNNYY